MIFATALAVGAFGWPWTPDYHGIGLLTNWDGNWYRRIAEHGYQVAAGESTTAFFPLLPMVMAAGIRVGVHPFLSALVVVEVVFLGALWALYGLFRNWLDEADARRAAIYVAIFPPSFVFAMAYPESLALAALAFAASAALAGRWWACATLSAAATLARPQSMLIAIPIAAIGWRATRGRPRSAMLSPLPAILAPAIALGAFSLYLWSAVGDPLAWIHAQEAWGRRLDLTGPKRAVGQVVYAPYADIFVAPYAVLWLVRDAIVTLLYVVLLGVAAKTRLPRYWLVYGLLVLALPVATGLFTSMSRLGLLAFPAFVGLATLTRRRRADIAVRAISLVLLAAFVVSVAYRYP